jgi:hypothetical protein
MVGAPSVAAAKRGAYTRWRSVQPQDAEQLVRRDVSPGKTGTCDERKIFQAFGIDNRTIEHRTVC